MSVSDALTYLATCADDYANAVMDEARLDELRKAIRAEFMRESDDKTIADREAFAITRKEYREVSEELLPDAKRRVAYHKARMKWADATIEVWRSQQANKRNAEKVR